MAWKREIKSRTLSFSCKRKTWKLNWCFQLITFIKLSPWYHRLCLQLLFKKTIRIFQTVEHFKVHSQHKSCVPELCWIFQHKYIGHTVLSISKHMMLMTLEWRLLVVPIKWRLLCVDRTKINTLSFAVRLIHPPSVPCVKRKPEIPSNSNKP